MRTLGEIFRLLGEIVLPVVFVLGLYLVIEGVATKRDGVVIAGAVMLGSLAIGGQISSGKKSD